MTSTGDLDDAHTTQPFSKTYPDMDTPDLVFGSCFTAASFTRGLRFVPALAAPIFRFGPWWPASCGTVALPGEPVVVHTPVAYVLLNARTFVH